MEERGASRMKHAKAPQEEDFPTPGSESWNKLPWHMLEQHVTRLQTRIFRAEQQGKTKAVHKLQKLLMKSRAARLLAVRRVTQDNQGKKTAGIDGVKSVAPAHRLVMVEQVHPKNWKQHPAQPVRRIYIPKTGKGRKAPSWYPDMCCTLPLFPGNVRDSMCPPPGGSEDSIHHHSITLPQTAFHFELGAASISA